MKNFLYKSFNTAITKDKPISLIHFLTNRCNARCAHCFVDFDDELLQKTEMSIDDIDRFTKTTGKQLMNVNFTGGEPFLYKEIEKAAELYINNAGVDSVYFSTNGGLSNKIINVANSLSNKYPNTVFTYSLSVDHLQEKHDEYRKVKNLYTNALKTYNKLRSLSENVNAHITITVSEFNYNDIREIFYYLKDVENVTNITANIVRDEGVYKTNPDKKQQIFQAYSELIQLITDYSLHQYSSNYLGRMMSHKEVVMYNYLTEYYMTPKYLLKCNAGAGLMGVIYPNGDVYPCEVLGKKMGNIINDNYDILAIWKKNKELRSQIKNHNCHCSYECAWSYNILSSPRHIFKLALAGVKNEK